MRFLLPFFFRKREHNSEKDRTGPNERGKNMPLKSRQNFVCKSENNNKNCFYKRKNKAKGLFVVIYPFVMVRHAAYYFYRTRRFTTTGNTDWVLNSRP